MRPPWESRPPEPALAVLAELHEYARDPRSSLTGRQLAARLGRPVADDLRILRGIGAVRCETPRATWPSGLRPIVLPEARYWVPDLLHAHDPGGRRGLAGAILDPEGFLATVERALAKCATSPWRTASPRSAEMISAELAYHGRFPEPPAWLVRAALEKLESEGRAWAVYSDPATKRPYHLPAGWSMHARVS